MKILILGGTKFAGLELTNRLIQNPEIDLTVASRRNLTNLKIKHIDRKSLNDLSALFTESFDLVIDFICFNKIDAEKLISALVMNNQFPKILSISTTYVYQNIQSCRNQYFENDFIADDFQEINLDWPNINYIDGKKSAEAYLQKNYPKELLCIFRFPMILGKDDPTNRTQYFLELIEKYPPINLSSNFSGRSHYISKFDVVNAIVAVINNFINGTYNVAVNSPLNQYELAQMINNVNTKELPIISNGVIPFSQSPFYYTEDFLINTDKFTEKYRMTFNHSGLKQDLTIISNANSNTL